MHDGFPYDLKFRLDYTFRTSLDDGIYLFFRLTFLNDVYESFIDHLLRFSTLKTMLTSTFLLLNGLRLLLKIP